jgi:hypothetical protein
LTKEVPYETAYELFQELTGLPLDAHTAHEVTQGLAVLDVAPNQGKVLAKIAAVGFLSATGTESKTGPGHNTFVSYDILRAGSA